MLIPNSTIVFLSSVPKMPVLGKFGSQTSKCFVLNETWCKGVFKVADFEFKNSFLKFRPYNTFFGQIWLQNFKVLCLE